MSCQVRVLRGARLAQLAPSVWRETPSPGVPRGSPPSAPLSLAPSPPPPQAEV